MLNNKKHFTLASTTDSLLWLFFQRTTLRVVNGITSFRILLAWLLFAIASLSRTYHLLLTAMKQGAGVGGVLKADTLDDKLNEWPQMLVDVPLWYWREDRPFHWQSMWRLLYVGCLFVMSCTIGWVFLMYLSMDQQLVIWPGIVEVLGNSTWMIFIVMIHWNKDNYISTILMHIHYTAVSNLFLFDVRFHQDVYISTMMDIFKYNNSYIDNKCSHL